MRKVLIVLLLLLICPSVIATTDSEIRAQRAVKQAYARILNKKIKEQKGLLFETMSNETLTIEERTQKINEIQGNLYVLYAEREQNAIEYRETKKAIKDK